MSQELTSLSRVGILVASKLSGIIGAAALSVHNQFKEFCLGSSRGEHVRHHLCCLHSTQKEFKRALCKPAQGQMICRRAKSPAAISGVNDRIGWRKVRGCGSCHRRCC
jgi:hypothetical protein